MTQIQAIIFDVDGTLADTEEVHRQAFNRAFAEFDLDWHWSPTLYGELLAISGGRERMRFFGRDLAANFPSEAAFSAHIAEIHRVKTKIYADLLVSGQVPLRPGVRRLLDEARAAGLGLAIATSTAASNVRTLLDSNLPADWPEWFEAVVTCDTVAEKKPSPAVYRAVLADTGFDPVRTVAIEDTVNGLRAARNAGLTTLITTHYFTRHEHFPDAALVVDGLGEPDAPYRVLSNADLAPGFVDLKLLDQLVSHAPAPTAAPGVDVPMPAPLPISAHA